jgi:hypothetical protein
MTSRQSRAKKFKSEFEQVGQVPSNILEEHEDDEEGREQGIENEVYDSEILRVLSPPPSELDYSYGQTRGETLAELFENDVY